MSKVKELEDWFLDIGIDGAVMFLFSELNGISFWERGSDEMFES